MKRAKIWIECACCNCGTVCGRFYRNRESISRLKHNTRNWMYDEKLGGNLCSECVREQKKEEAISL